MGMVVDASSFLWKIFFGFVNVVLMQKMRLSWCSSGLGPILGSALTTVIVFIPVLTLNLPVG